MLFADLGHDHGKYRRLLYEHGIRRLRMRRERRDDIHEAVLGRAVCMITHRHVQRPCQVRASQEGPLPLAAWCRKAEARAVRPPVRQTMA